MLASLGVKPAEPFDWGDEPRMTLEQSAPPAERTAPLSGLDALRNCVRGQTSGTDDNERRILRALFERAGVDPSAPSGAAPARPPSPHGEHAAPDGWAMRDVSIRGLSDRAVAELAVEGRTSLFGSILRLFDAPRAGDGTGAGRTGSAAVGAAAEPAIASEPVLSAAEIVRSVHLSCRPGDIPAGMDSKEYALAALCFLATRVPHLHEDEGEYRTRGNEGSREGWEQLRATLPVLPLIGATNPGESPELRRYGRARPLIAPGRTGGRHSDVRLDAGGCRREQPDSMDRDPAFRRKVLNLERVFSSSLPFAPPSMASRPSAAVRPTSATLPPSEASNAVQNGRELPFAFQRYVPRRKLLPHIEGGAKEELTLMISGHMQQPQHTPGPKPKGDRMAPPASVSAAADQGRSAAVTSKRKGGALADGSIRLAKKETDLAI